MPAPQRIADVLSELISRRGYAREQSGGVDRAVWSEVAGPQLAAHTRVGELKRGVLEIFAANNMVLSELGFHKARLLAELTPRLPQIKLTGLRFKVGQM